MNVLGHVTGWNVSFSRFYFCETCETRGTWMFVTLDYIPLWSKVKERGILFWEVGWVTLLPKSHVSSVSLVSHHQMVCK